MAKLCGTCDYTYVGKGKVKVDPDGKGLIFLGNINNVNISNTVTEDSVTDYTETGGGNCSTRSFIDASNLTMDLWNLCAPNWALLTGGKSTESPIAVIADEAHTGYQCRSISLLELMDKTVAPVVKDAGTNAPYTVDVDYTVTEYGIEIVDGGGIADATDLLIDYTSVAKSKI